MPYRRDIFREGEVYHIFSKSIAGFKIFRNKKEYSRMVELLKFYRKKESEKRRFSQAIHKEEKTYQNNKDNNIVKIIAYCLMPTHFHLILTSEDEGVISYFMKKVLGSYAKYFNLKIKRKGPLWESRFKSVKVETDEQLLHLTRYIHLNPVTGGLVEKPEEWLFSSYREYLNMVKEEEKICEYSDFLDVSPSSYKDFVESRIEYQKELALIKKLLIE